MVLSKKDWGLLNDASGRLNEAHVYIEDSTEVTVTQIRAKARRLQMKKGLGLIIIGYLHLIKVANRPDRRDLEISEISRLLKALAKELKLPVIALS